MKKNIAITFEDLSQEWLTEKKITVKESTYVKYYNILQKHILPFMGERLINQIDAQFLIRFTHQIISGDLSQRRLADKSIRDILSVLNNILKYAKIYYSEFIQSVEIVYPQGPHTQTKTQILSCSDQNTLEEFLLKNMDLPKLGIYICLYTGLRVGEICGLKWKDINLEEEIISVKRTVQRLQTLDPNAPAKTRLLIDTPKSSCSIRFIPIPSHMLPIIQSFCPNQGEKYILTGNTEKCMEPRTLENHFARFLKQASEMSVKRGHPSMNTSNLTIHSLRHTFATRCVEAGVEIKCLSEILGHSNVNITLNRYVHSSIEMKRININKLAPLYSNTKADI